MTRAEKILKDSANSHSYESWPEMVYDCHDQIVIDYTAEAMKQAAWEAWVKINSMVKPMGFVMNESIMEYEFENWWNEEVE
jgi:hypothetical protein